jgi:hypothetical protein
MRPDNVYHLYVRIGEAWHWLGNIYAQTYDEARREAIASLDARHYDKPIRLEYDQAAPTNCGRRVGDGLRLHSFLGDPFNNLPA